MDLSLSRSTCSNLMDLSTIRVGLVVEAMLGSEGRESWWWQGVFVVTKMIGDGGNGRLVNNLCTVWIGRHKIHANLARFKRPHVSGVKILTKNEGSKSGSSIHSKKQEVADKGFNVPNSSNNSFAQAVKGDKLYGGVRTESGHALVLDDEWGVLLDIDDQEETCYHSKRLCVHMKSGRSILENFKIIHRGKVFWVQASETPGWVPDFTDESDEDEPDDEMSKDGGFNDHVPDMEGVSNEKVDRSEDPFLIYLILEKKNHLNPTDNNSVGSIKYPHGFTPLVRSDVDVNVDNDEEVKVFSVGKDNDRSCDNKSNNCSREDCRESAVSGHFKKSMKPRTGGSIVGVLDELVKVGQVMGYNIEGCKSNMADIIRSQGAKDVFR
nr:nucleotide-binding alpha-beta plait domain-containing protein [Tanacetum cinerariifolium]